MQPINMSIPGWLGFIMIVLGAVVLATWIGEVL